MGEGLLTMALVVENAVSGYRRLRGDEMGRFWR